MNDAMQHGVDGTVLAGRFSTRGIPERDRHEIWRGLGARSVGQLFEATPAEPFSTQADYVKLGELTVTFSTVSGQAYLRNGGMIAADGVDHLGISIRFDGAARGEMDGKAVAAPSGSILLTDMARLQQHVSEPFSGATLMLPRQFAESFLPPVRDLHGMVVAPNAAALLGAHLKQIHRHSSSISARHGARLARTVTDLLAVAVGQNAPLTVSEIARETAARMRAKCYIEERLTSSTLTVDSLCRALSTSRSALYRLFEDDGGVLAYVRERRLERVAAVLRDPVNNQRIAALADRFGFVDAAYLTRVFRDTYGMTPGAFRAQHGKID